MSHNSLHLLVSLKIKQPDEIVFSACYYEFLTLTDNHLVDLLQVSWLAVIVSEIYETFLLPC